MGVRKLPALPGGLGHFERFTRSFSRLIAAQGEARKAKVPSDLHRH